MIMMVAVADELSSIAETNTGQTGHSGRCERFIAVHSEQVSGQSDVRLCSIELDDGKLV
jgi:hypothetical protein